eukprot:CAMPEP_0197944672 /NCGR_PEP_ID=MMETSP1439-20131203/125528_1 /TAXON_ID=66791 /ORGANISM="Gonyaulax spinifera, Strain CCMP409" /LENGTH=259 /DNA_ID=CAMNT_0043567925 /DNA_START=51 /DNA_END=827 /DNA_ORIENTATION=-
MASSADESESLTPHKSYNVVNYVQSMQLCCLLQQTLTLEPEEAVLKTSTCISDATKRMPYAELGSVEHERACGCCHSFNSNLSPVDEHGQKQPIVPGCGCSGDLVQEIVDELKARMKGRGDTGNIQRAEDAIRVMKRVDAKVDALLAAMKAQPVQAVAPDFEEFTHLDYDVSSVCRKACCCGHQHLNLEHEEAMVESTTCISRSVQRRPYGQLGSVDEVNCCCTHAVNSGLGLYQPGWGCEKELVAEVVLELKRRMKAR